MLFRYISTLAASRAVDGDREGKVGELLGRVVRSACLSVFIHSQAIASDHGHNVWEGARV
jgi:hypothetical protein